MRYLWLDLETTGLDPQHDRIIEVAAILTPDGDLFPTEDEVCTGCGNGECVNLCRYCHYEFPNSYEALVNPVLEYQHWARTMKPVPLAMHQRSGLLRLACDSAIYGINSEHSIMELIERNRADNDETDETVTLAGSSIHFDRAFIKAQMPRLDRLLHYRHLDVSAIGTVCQHLGMPDEPHEAVHRAMPDILASIALMRRCCEWIQRGHTSERQLANVIEARCDRDQARRERDDARDLVGKLERRLADALTIRP
jgi:oligoribonuclease